MHYYVKCPHCNKTIESGSIRSTRYGSPFRPCRNCGHISFDKGYKEAGLMTRKEFKKIAAEPWGIISFLFLALYLLFAGAKRETFGEWITSGGWVILLFAAIGCIPILTYVLYNPEKDQKLQEEIKASNKRLQNPRYVLALYRAGFDIPPLLLKWAEKSDIQ